MAENIHMCAYCKIRRCQLGSKWCQRCEMFYKPSLTCQDLNNNPEAKKLCIICLKKFPEQNYDLCLDCICSVNSPLPIFTPEFPICVQCRTTVANPGYSLCQNCHQAEITAVSLTPNDSPESAQIDQVSRLIEVPKRLIHSTSSELDSDISHCLCPSCYEDWDSPSNLTYCVSCFGAVVSCDSICNKCRMKLPH